MGFYPDLERLLELPTKNRLLVLHRSVRSSIGLVITFVGMVISLFGIALRLSALERSVGVIPWETLVKVLAVAPALVGLEIVRRYYNDVYIVGRDKVTHYRGRISLKFATPSVRNIDLRAITVNQGLLGRIVDFGDVALATAAQEGPEIIFGGVRAPHELAKLIDDLRQKSQRASFESATTEQSVVQALQND